jgi:hypothetical protein
MASACRRALLRAIPALVLAALLAPAVSPTALAATDGDRAARATERYYSSYGAPDGDAAALATERYYSSYGEPESPAAPAAVAQSPDRDGPSWAAAIIAGVLVAAAAAGAGVLAGRSTVRPRAARA